MAYCTLHSQTTNIDYFQSIYAKAIIRWTLTIISLWHTNQVHSLSLRVEGWQPEIERWKQRAHDDLIATLDLYLYQMSANTTQVGFSHFTVLSFSHLVVNVCASAKPGWPKNPIYISYLLYLYLISETAKVYLLSYYIHSEIYTRRNNRYLVYVLTFHITRNNKI